jgi:hypothetical protein
VPQDVLASLRRLSDAELEARVRDLAARERGATALLVAHLAELDTREVHFRAGHGSLFAYCREILGLAEQEAYNRIAVARSARRFPVILELLENGALSLTTARILGPHLTPVNHASVLEKARGKSKAQVEELAAALWPRPDAPTFVRKLPSAASRAVPGALDERASPASGEGSRAAQSFPAGSGSPRRQVPESAESGACLPAPAPALPGDPSALPPVAGVGWAGSPSPGDSARLHPPTGSITSPPTSPIPGQITHGSGTRRSAEVTPLAPDRYKVQVTIGAETLEKLRLAQDLLRHSLPSGDEAAILDRALTALLEDLARRKFAAAAKPRPGEGAAPGSRHIPAEVRRKVWLRDAARCAFIGPSGRRCSERAFLEFHHVKPFALGGEASVENIQLRCRSHNAYEARLYFDPRNGSGGAGAVREAAGAYSRARARDRGPSAISSACSRGPAHALSPAFAPASTSGLSSRLSSELGPMRQTRSGTSCATPRSSGSPRTPGRRARSSPRSRGRPGGPAP